MTLCGVLSMNWRSNRAKWAVVCLAVLLLFSQQGTAICQTKGHGVEVRIVSSPVVDSVSGETLTLSFTVTNKTTQQEEFIENLELPSEWRVINPATTIVLENGKSQARIFAVLVPASTSAGVYDVTYSVHSRRDPAIRDFDSVKINVLPVSRIKILPEGQPINVIAGEEYLVNLRVLNEGNAQSHLLIAVRSTQGSIVQVDPDVAVLIPGGSLVIAVRVKTSAKINRRVKDRLLVEARYADDKTPLAAGVTVSVDIIPRLTGEDDIFHRIPSTVNLRMMGSGNGATNQIQFSGSGSLDDEGHKKIDFLLRGPNTQNAGVFGERDQQYLNYSKENLDVRAGDQNFTLSRLTEYYRYGRGLAFDTRRPRGIEFGAYTSQQRWGSPDEREAGFYIRKNINDKLSLKFNALDKRVDSPLGFRDRLLSLEASMTPVRNTNINFEYGTCSTNRNVHGDKQAYSFRLDGNNRGAHYSLERIHAGPGYYGYYRDTDYTSGTISFPLSERLRMRVLTRTWRQNLDLNESRGTSPKETHNQFGMSYALPSGVHISLDTGWLHRYDLQQPSGFNYSERSLRLGAGKSFGNYSIQTYVTDGSQKDFLDGTMDHISRYSVYGSFRPSARQYYSIYAQMGDCMNGETHLLGGNNSVGFYGQWKPTDQLTCTLLYGIDQPDINGRPDLHQFYFTGAYEFTGGKKLVLRARNLDGITGPDTRSFLISYELPWGIPVSKKKNMGVIKGRIYDSEDPKKAGIPRAIVTANGATTITDNQGNFEFKSLAAGTYSVVLDRNSIGLKRIPTCKVPITVEVKRNESTEVEIGTARSTGLFGNVSIYSRSMLSKENDEGKLINFTSNGTFVEGDRGSNLSTGNSEYDHNEPGMSDLTKGAGLQNILVELTNDHSEVLRTLTDTKGDFSFDDLAPGQWRLKVYKHNLPTFHELENGQMEFDLEPGTKSTVPIRVVPRLRPVKIIEQGQLYSKAETDTPGNTVNILH